MTNLNASDWISCAQTIQTYEEQKKKLEAADNKAKVLREQLEEWEKKEKTLKDETDNIKLEIHDLKKEQEELTELYRTNLDSTTDGHCQRGLFRTTTY